MLQRIKRPSSRPARDPALDVVLNKIGNRTPKEIAEASIAGGGITVGASTVANWKSGKTRTPLHYTLEAALNAAGFEYAIRRKRS